MPTSCDCCCGAMIAFSRPPQARRRDEEVTVMSLGRNNRSPCLNGLSFAGTKATTDRTSEALLDASRCMRASAVLESQDDSVTTGVCPPWICDMQDAATIGNNATHLLLCKGAASGSTKQTDMAGSTLRKACLGTSQNRRKGCHKCHRKITFLPKLAAMIKTRQP